MALGDVVSGHGGTGLDILEVFSNFYGPQIFYDPSNLSHSVIFIFLFLIHRCAMCSWLSKDRRQADFIKLLLHFMSHLGT